MEQLSIHADSKGLGVLINRLSQIKAQVDSGNCSHLHLMSNAWGGGELSEFVPEKDGTLIHHVKMYGWTTDRAEQHGLAKQWSAGESGTAA